MTVEEKAGKVIARTLLDDTRTASLGIDQGTATGLASVAVRSLYGSGIYLREEPRSKDMSTRFHAHLSWVVRHAPGEDRDQLYSRILNEAVNRGLYPFTVVSQKVVVNSAVFTVDVKVPHSTTRASNRELMAAYGILEEVAAELGVALPEKENYDG